MAEQAAFVAYASGAPSGICVGGYTFNIEKALEEGKGVIETKNPQQIDACRRAGLREIDPATAKEHRKR